MESATFPRQRHLGPWRARPAHAARKILAARHAAALLSALALALGTLLAQGPISPGSASVSAMTVCGAERYVQGIDVSSHQGAIDWRAVAATGIRFGMARIADGTTFPDPTFQANYAGMRATGITPGSYIYFEPAQDPVAQANIVVAALGAAGFRLGDLPPAIDIEVSRGQSSATIASRLRTAVTTIEEAIGVAPLIYASPNTWSRIVASTDFGDVPLWIAHWLVACPNTATGWSSWALWQFTSSGVVPGIAGPVDLDQSPGESLPVYSGAPVFLGRPDVAVYALGSTAVTFVASAVGYRGAAVDSACAPASGSVFALGTSLVTCTAINTFGKTTRQFAVTVRRAEPPIFDSALPDEIATVASGPSGATVSWDPMLAIDFAGAPLPAACQPASGSTFAIGRTSVSCTATDTFGQTASRSFTVSVALGLGAFTAPIADPITATSPVAIFPAGSTVPVRFGLAYADGTPLADGDAASLANDCRVTAWLAPWEGQVLTAAGTLTADGAMLSCAGYDPATHQFVADVSLGPDAAQGDYTLVTVLVDQAGRQLAGHVGEISVR